MRLSELFLIIKENPILLLSYILISGVITVNGWTDAPTAIATCISSRTITPKRAIYLAAAMNFAGVFVMSQFSGKVVSSITHIADFGNDNRIAALAMSAALLSIILWAVTAWFFGIPTSESHALIAALSGAAIAVNKTFDGINISEWSKVISGLFISTVSGFLLGYIIVKIISLLIKNSDKTKTDRNFVYLQNLSAAFMAFMHGAQDGQKFIGVFLLSSSYFSNTDSKSENIPVFLIIYCSVLMALGTSIGGMRIIKSMGADMIRLKKYQGFGADLAGAVSLLISTLTGLPVSTTHTKTTAIMGVGAANRLSSVDWQIAKEMILTWILTFPGCGFLGYLITVIFISIRW